jgi:hypothetical protein
MRSYRRSRPTELLYRAFCHRVISSGELTLSVKQSFVALQDKRDGTSDDKGSA